VPPTQFGLTRRYGARRRRGRRQRSTWPETCRRVLRDNRWCV